MSAKVTVKRNFSLANVALTTVPDMRELGLLVRERIIRRTRQGIGADGRPFQDLSINYAVDKLKHLGTARPDLTVSGNLLNHIQLVDVTDNTVTLGWLQ